jgi:hypothetical protein
LEVIVVGWTDVSVCVVETVTGGGVEVTMLVAVVETVIVLVDVVVEAGKVEVCNTVVVTDCVTFCCEVTTAGVRVVVLQSTS